MIAYDPRLTWPESHQPEDPPVEIGPVRFLAAVAVIVAVLTAAVLGGLELWGMVAEWMGELL